MLVPPCPIHVIERLTSGGCMRITNGRGTRIAS